MEAVDPDEGDILVQLLPFPLDPFMVVYRRL